MFTISTGHHPSRRVFLRVGGLGLGGLTRAQLLEAGAAASETRRTVTGKSVIFLHMHGGPSQFETFDPKMSAPAEIRSVTGETQTRLPGVTFGPTFSRLARLADKLAAVRSYGPAYDHSASPIINRETHNAERQAAELSAGAGRASAPVPGRGGRTRCWS